MNEEKDTTKDAKEEIGSIKKESSTEKIENTTDEKLLPKEGLKKKRRKLKKRKRRKKAFAVKRLEKTKKQIVEMPMESVPEIKIETSSLMPPTPPTSLKNSHNIAQESLPFIVQNTIKSTPKPLFLFSEIQPAFHQATLESRPTEASKPRNEPNFVQISRTQGMNNERNEGERTQTITIKETTRNPVEDTKISLLRNFIKEKVSPKMRFIPSPRQEEATSLPNKKSIAENIVPAFLSFQVKPQVEPLVSKQTPRTFIKDVETKDATTFPSVPLSRTSKHAFNTHRNKIADPITNPNMETPRNTDARNKPTLHVVPKELTQHILSEKSTKDVFQGNVVQKLTEGQQLGPLPNINTLQVKPVVQKQRYCNKITIS